MDGDKPVSPEGSSVKKQRIDATFLSRALIILFVIMIAVGALVAVALLSRPLSEHLPEGASVDLDLHPEETTWPIVPDSSGRPIPIAGIAAVNPAGNGMEHADQAGLAADGNVESAWQTGVYRYPKQPTGIGLALTLNPGEKLRSVRVNTTAQGGKVQLRATNAANPSGGTVLDTQALTDSTVFNIEAAEPLESLVLWCVELPKGPGGEYRLIVSEIEVTGK